MTATNMCSNFGVFRFSPPILVQNFLKRHSQSNQFLKIRKFGKDLRNWELKLKHASKLIQQLYFSKEVNVQLVSGNACLLYYHNH